MSVSLICLRVEGGGGWSLAGGAILETGKRELSWRGSESKDK